MGLSHDLRLERAMRDIKVRFARDSEGMVIAQMVHCSHDAVPTTAWEHVYPFWLVAEHGGEVVGCVNMCFSKPVGRMEFLSFAPSLAYRTRALAVKALLAMAEKTLANAGSKVVAGCLAFSDKSFKDILKKEGCIVLTSGHVLSKAVA